jgi:hypothetical protein
MALTGDDIKLIGNEMVRLLEPVYEDLDEIKKTLRQHSVTLEEHGEKIDALTLEIHEVKQELGGGKDVFSAFKDKTELRLDRVEGQLKLPKII